MKLKIILAAMAATMLATGCGIADETTVSIIKALPIDDNCTSAPGAESILRGGFDVSFTNADYVQSFEIRNNLEDNAEPPFRLNSNNFITERAVVSYSSAIDADNVTLGALGARQTALTITLEPTSENGVFVNLIAADVATLIRDQIVPNPGDQKEVIATFFVEGHLADGQGSYDGKCESGDPCKMKSHDFAFPIVVCNNCFVCPVGYTQVFACGPGQAPFECEPPTP